MKKIESKRGWEAVLRLRIRVLAAGLTALLLMFPLGVRAESSLSLNVQILLEGTLPAEPDVFTVEIASEGMGAPMPEGSTGQSYRASRNGAGALPLGTIICRKPGRWNYIIRQIPSGADCIHDAREYRLQISAYTGENGTLDMMATLHQNGAEGKLEEICFLNTYPTVQEKEPGSATRTGVQDQWLYYLCGAVALMLAALWLIVLLLRRRKGGE